MKKQIIILILIFLNKFTFAQSSNIDVAIHARVDTSNLEIKQIITLYTNYLTSKPDSVYDNPYWNNEEKKQFIDFDLTRRFIYQFPSEKILNYYKPTILSIEKQGDVYAIRTLFSADGLEGEYKKSNPWCITNIYAVNENGKWKLKNALPFLTKNWLRKKIGKITYIYPPEHKFNDSLALRANKFCNDLADKFQFYDWKSFDFYIAKNADDMGKLLGFDFYYAGYTTGVSMEDKRILFSGMDSEWYPHEFVHLIVENKNRHKMIEEGFATWNGGSMKLSFEENAKILAEQMATNDSIKFTDILNQIWGWQYNAYYTTGAMICKLAYDKKGIAAVKKLLDTPNSDTILISELCGLFNINEKDLSVYLKNEILKYARSTNAQQKD